MSIAFLMLALLPLNAQGQPPAAIDGVPAITNVSGAQYPRITADLRVILRIKAPDAQKVEFDLGKRYLAQKFEALAGRLGLLPK